MIFEIEEVTLKSDMPVGEPANVDRLWLVHEGSMLHPITEILDDTATVLAPVKSTRAWYFRENDAHVLMTTEWPEWKPGAHHHIFVKLPKPIEKFGQTIVGFVASGEMVDPAETGAKVRNLALNAGSVQPTNPTGSSQFFQNAVTGKPGKPAKMFGAKNTKRTKLKTVVVQGTSKAYEVAIYDDYSVSCPCGAWKMNPNRHCKHMDDPKVIDVWNKL